MVDCLYKPVYAIWTFLWQFFDNICSLSEKDSASKWCQLSRLLLSIPRRMWNWLPEIGCRKWKWHTVRNSDIGCRISEFGISMLFSYAFLLLLFFLPFLSSFFFFLFLPVSLAIYLEWSFMKLYLPKYWILPVCIGTITYG